MKNSSPFYKTGVSNSPFHQELSGKEKRQAKKAGKKIVKARKKLNKVNEVVSFSNGAKFVPETPKDGRKLSAAKRKAKKGQAIYGSLSEAGKVKAKEVYKEGKKKHFPSWSIPQTTLEQMKKHK